MSKYDPLTSHLATQHREFVPMTFADIEKLINGALPPSARKYPAWWSNNPSNSVMTVAWRNAGYKSQDVDIAGERVVFRRVRNADDVKISSDAGHPLLGALTGKVRVTFDVDLTDPADANWDAQLQ